MFREFWKVLTQADSYENNWYGWSKNQSAHAFYGLITVWVICIIAWFISGDLPYKERIFAGIAIAYAAKEIFWDRWQGWDTLEDFIFFVIYGAGGTLLAFKQIEDHTADVSFNILNALPTLCAFFLHLTIGIIVRMRRAMNVGRATR